MSNVSLRSNRARISGDAVSATVSVSATADISGTTVRINDSLGNPVETVSFGGERFVKVWISGQSVTTTGGGGGASNVSGNAVRISGESVRISGETVSVSGLVATSVSGNAVGVSGQGVRLMGTNTNVVDVFGANDTDNTILLSSNLLLVGAQMMGFDGLSGFTRVRVEGSGVGRLMVYSSGGAMLVSGQAVLISGQTVSIAGTVPVSASGNVVQISGQTVSVTGTLSSNVSGNVVRVSGETVSVSGVVSITGPVSTSVSGNAVKISGETIVVTGVNVSGNTVSLSDISGNAIETLSVGGQNYVKAWISGQAVTTTVNTTTNISGQYVYLSASGTTNHVDADTLTSDLRSANRVGLATMSTLWGYDADSARFSRVRVTSSGTPRPYALLAAISGEPVRVSGEAVKISGETVSIAGTVAVTTNVSGNTTRISDTSGLPIETISFGGDRYIKAWISGQAVTTTVNTTTNISGQLIYLSASGTTSHADVVSAASDVKATTRLGLATVSMLHGFNEDSNNWSRIRVTASGGFKLIATVSGDPVQTSGQSVRLTDVSGNAIETLSIGGERYIKTWISGQSVSTTVTTNISGNAVRVSGETVSVSGTVAITGTVAVSTSISGNAVRISGQTVLIDSTTPVNVMGSMSGNAVGVSGQSIRIVGGTGSNQVDSFGTNDDDSTILLSSNPLLTAAEMMAFDGQSGFTRVRVEGSGVGRLLVYSSGGAMLVSGQSLYLSASGTGTHADVVNSASDTRAATRIGLLTSTHSYAYDEPGNQWARMRMNATSATVKPYALIVATSGDNFKEFGSSLLNGGSTVITSLSGGTALASGSVFKVTVRSISGNNVMWIGGTGSNAPFSGSGLILYGGEAYTAPVNNPASIQIFAATSGQRIHYIGMVT